MTTPQIDDLALDEPFDLMAWLDRNGRLVTMAAVVVILAGAGYWLITQNKRNKEINGSKALFQAKQSIAAGNPQLAQSDLQKVATRYDGTSSGSEGAMLLAGLDYDQNKFQEGITVLETASKSAPKALVPALRALIGDGLLSMKNGVSAAKEYEKAAELTNKDLDRGALRAKAARAYAVGGDTAKARTLWADLVANSKNPSVAAEAKIRLAELTAKPIR